MYRDNRPLTGPGIVSVRKDVVETVIEKYGKWSGWVSPNNVNGWHIKDGWHIGHSCEFRTVAEMRDLEFRYLSYNANSELGWRARYWQSTQSTQPLTAPKTVRHYFTAPNATYTVKLSRLGKSTEGKPQIWYSFGLQGSKSPIFSGNDYFLSPLIPDWRRRAVAADLFAFFEFWAEDADRYSDTEAQKSFLESEDCAFLAAAYGRD